MSLVFFELSRSLDGYVARPNVSVCNPLGDGGERLYDWTFPDRTEGEERAFGEQSFRPAGAMVKGGTTHHFVTDGLEQALEMCTGSSSVGR